MKRNITIVLGIILFSIAFIFLNGKEMFQQKEVGNNQTLSVVASFYPLYFFAQEIGGERVAVTSLTPPGAEPHDFEPDAKQRIQIENSDVFLYNGRGLDVWADTIAQQIQQKNISVVRATNVLQDDTVIDPHIWLDPFYAQKISEQIYTAFSSQDPQNTQYYKQRLDNLIHRLQILDNQYTTSLKSCKKHTIITSHDAFGYLASRYGFSVRAVTGLSPEEEPSPQTLSTITTYIHQENISYIFTETLLSSKISQTLSQETGAQMLVFDPIEGLTQEGIDKQDDYFTIQERNLSHLRQAMECE